ncbi:MAG: glycosyltransferase, partial [Luteimonas sp.]
FLFASTSETFGNVILEAMASGVATVAFDYGATRETLRDGVRGAAIATGDEQGFIAAACRIAADRDLRIAMGRQARAAVSGLRPEQVYADFESILMRLAADRASHARIAAA